ncbi:uncharacterized protein LOC113460896 isoform X4 [Zonotrichia albicollis]|uniref:uncharacterized protein LOC113460896 isoform X4 n=1 Tax=Zonotrichia albicollis TaxID=44394 RepID=UPI003D81163A
MAGREFKESKFSTAAAFTNSRCEDLRTVPSGVIFSLSHFFSSNSLVHSWSSRSAEHLDCGTSVPLSMITYRWYENTEIQRVPMALRQNYVEWRIPSERLKNMEMLWMNEARLSSEEKALVYLKRATGDGRPEIGSDPHATSKKTQKQCVYPTCTLGSPGSIPVLRNSSSPKELQTPPNSHFYNALWVQDW